MEAAEVRIAFEQTIVLLSLDLILPLKQVPDTQKSLSKYKRIAKSIAEVGIIEPLVVSQQPDEHGKYLLLDGHTRLAILSDQGKSLGCSLHSGA